MRHGLRTDQGRRSDLDWRELETGDSSGRFADHGNERTARTESAIALNMVLARTITRLAWVVRTPIDQKMGAAYLHLHGYNIRWLFD